MKKIHYCNIGIQKSGTTWLYRKLLEHPEVDFKSIDDKENHFFSQKFSDKNDYLKLYENYDVTLNFSTQLYAIHPNLIEYLDEHATHISIILKNPFDWHQSFYWFCIDTGVFTGETDKNFDVFFNTIKVKKFVSYNHWIGLWNKRLKNNKLKIFLYDDLVKDYQSFYNDATDFLGLSRRKVYNNRLLVTKYKGNYDFKDHEIRFFNEEIEKLQDICDLDVEHWKR